MLGPGARNFRKTIIIPIFQIWTQGPPSEQRHYLNAGTRESQEQRQPDMTIGEHKGSVTETELVATPNGQQSNSFFNNAKSVNIKGRPSFQNNITNVFGGGINELDSVKKFVSFDAQFDSSAQDPQRQCHPGTRENVLKKLRDWVDDRNTIERISWLCGPVGAGKSAIAQTIAQSYERPKIAATFFFCRSDVPRNDGNRLFITLAYQLALSIPVIKEHIAHFLDERPDLPRTNVETQFELLLLRPFQLLPKIETRQLAPVVVIDGIDECKDEDLQRRFLKVIGDAVADDHFPLRFLIVSRLEYHIERTIRHFKNPVLTIDLAKLDDADRDIEKYLVDEFSRIASEQELEPTWPGQDIIQDIVCKSSGNFIFAALVVKFVGDTDHFPKTQLEIILNMAPRPNTMSPFAMLDRLFLEILKRVPNQDFLKRYLPLLTARIAISSDIDLLYKDDAVLMHVSEKELQVHLRRMYALLKFGPQGQIEVYHQCFLDFLHDSSRSEQYYIVKRGGLRHYLEVFVDSLARYVSTMIKKPDHHNTCHFKPIFGTIITDFPSKIELSIDEWRESMRPLLDLQDNLRSLDFTPAWSCEQCTALHLLREFLLFCLRKGIIIEQPNHQEYADFLTLDISLLSLSDGNSASNARPTTL